MFQRHPVRQVAYFTRDVITAARDHSRQFGSGPYFVAEHIPLRKVLHRGHEVALDHSSAYGQWGEVMVEFVQQNNPGPSVFHDIYPEGAGGFGFHHVALIVDSLTAARREFVDLGFAECLHAEMNDGFTFVMMDAVARYGHMIEIYEAAPLLTSFYATVKEASRGFEGTEVIRSIKF